MNQELGEVAGLHLRSVFCISFGNLQREVYGYGLMISAFIGLLGAIFQLVLWRSYLRNHDSRHKPSSNPHIVFNLALSNALACLGMSSLLIYGLLHCSGFVQSGKIRNKFEVLWKGKENQGAFFISLEK